MKKRIQYSGRVCRGLAVLLLCAGLTGCAKKTELVFETAEESQKEAVDDNPSYAPETGEAAKQEAPGAPTPTVIPARIYVDVQGAVASPGVYELSEGSHVFQAVEAAGGLLPEAAAGYVNQAELLSDGRQLYFPTEEETEQQRASGNPGVQGQDSLDDGKTDEANQASGKVNINTADEAALCTLSGIGPSKAGAILAYREEKGGFSSVEELMDVPGIKEGTFAKIKDEIVAE